MEISNSIISELMVSSLKIRITERMLLDTFLTKNVGGTIHTCIGQELAAATIGYLSNREDYFVSNHRCHGHYLGKYADYKGLISEILGSPDGVNQGFGGSQHIFRQRFSSNGIQGGLVPFACGRAFANKMLNNGDLVFCFLGDGTFGQGVLYEAFNISSKWGVPIVFVVENNFYAQSTSQNETLAGTFENRSKAFDIKHFETTTDDVEELLSTSEGAIKYSRENQRPSVLEIKTYRLGSHSTKDDTRNVEEVKKAKAKDLVYKFEKDLVPESVLGKVFLDFTDEIASMISAALNQSNDIGLERFTDHQGSQLSVPKAIGVVEQDLKQSKQINRALKLAMTEDPKFILLGQDLRDPYGGAFKVTLGLSSEFSTQVINTPISESATIGVAIGLASSGFRVVVEVMFGDFLPLAFDQILSQASKLSDLSGGKLKLPFVIRTPMGGRRGYGASHSQNLEKYFFGIPKVDCFMLNARIDAEKFYSLLFRGLDKPTIVFENKAFYGTVPEGSVPEGYSIINSADVFSHSHLSHKLKPDITVICFGGASAPLDQVIEKLNLEEIYLDIFYPVRLGSFDITEIALSVGRTGCLYIVEDGTAVGGLSHEIFFQIFNRGGLVGDLPIYKIRTSLGHAIPTARKPESLIFPSQKEIFDDLLEIFDEK